MLERSKKLLWWFYHAMESAFNPVTFLNNVEFKPVKKGECQVVLIKFLSANIIYC